MNYRSPRTRAAYRKLTRQPSIYDMRIGDIVQHLDRDWVVEDKLIYQEEYFVWLEYMLQDDNDIRWLSVEEDDLLKVSILAKVSSLELVGPPSRKLTYENETYHLTESGTARMRRQGSSLRPSFETCRYFDYKTSDNKVLSIEDWDGNIEITAGKLIEPEALTILPGESGSVYH